MGNWKGIKKMICRYRNPLNSYTPLRAVEEHNFHPSPCQPIRLSLELHAYRVIIMEGHQLAGPLVSIQSSERWYDAIKQDAGVWLEAGADKVLVDGGRTVVSAPSNERGAIDALVVGRSDSELIK